MKRRPIILPIAVMGFGVLIAYALAQRSVPAGATGELAVGIALLADGRPQEAKEVIAAIDKDAPDYKVARCYYALCLYELNDDLRFLKEVEKSAVKEANVGPKIREDLEFKEIDTLFRYKGYERLLSRIHVFWSESPNSSRLATVIEYQMASLFEQGMKKAEEASIIGDSDRFDRRWAETRTNLQEFLALASAFGGSNYTVLPQRTLREDIWMARMTLGEEEAALEEVPILDTASREKFSLLRIRLYYTMQPEQTDRNLQMMKQFIEEFPLSKGRQRVEFDMASIGFHRGEAICMEAAATEEAGDVEAAAELRAAAHRYFKPARLLQRRVVSDQESGLKASDIRDLREDLLCSYYWEKDFANLAAETSSLKESSTPGDLDWILARTFEGITLLQVSLAATDAAAEIFDEVMEINFNGKPDHDRLVSVATLWRVSIALRVGDLEKVREIIHWVEASDCTENIKTGFLEDNQELVDPQHSNTP